jgi:hypothetical protein
VASSAQLGDEFDKIIAKTPTNTDAPQIFAAEYF